MCCVIQSNVTNLQIVVRLRNKLIIDIVLESNYEKYLKTIFA